MASGAGERGLAGGPSGRFVEFVAKQSRFGRVAPPRLCRDAAKPDPHGADNVTVKIQGDRGGGQGKFVRLSVADLQEQRSSVPRPDWHAKAGNQLARPERGFDMGRIAGQAMKILESDDAARRSAFEIHGGTSAASAVAKSPG